MKSGAAAVALLLALSSVAGQARAEDPIAVGRYHLRKANQLADDDHCHSAIHEYTIAYQKLKDPVVLFNRAECYRRIHQSEKAISDYRAFLAAVPAAPNRTEIEAKIATMIAALSGPPPGPVAARPAPARSAAPRPGAPPPPGALPPEPPPPALPPDIRALEEPPPAPPAAAAPPAVVVATPAPVKPEPEAEGHHGHAWIWVALGAAVAGGAVGAYFALRPPVTTPPDTQLGNYKF
ncbi:MAG TPA: hypothetical protein VKZ18_07865 [Polyangia bacterium]|nr:hypothetical protein [Polyangia bacterium]